MSTNDHPDQETERTQLRVRHGELQPQVGRRGDLSATASGDVVSPAFTPIRNTTFRTTSVNRPETSSSPWHDVSTNVAYGRPHGCTATGLAASPAMGEGTTRDHFGREAAAVITSAKGETEAATRPTARARRRLPALRQALSAGLEQLTSWRERERNRIEWVRPDAGALCCLRLRRDAFDDAHVAAFLDLLPHHTCRCAPDHQPLLVSDQGAAAVSWTPELERPRRQRRM